MDYRKEISTEIAFQDAQVSFFEDLLKEFIPGTLQVRKNGTYFQYYIQFKGMKSEYISVPNRPLARELAVKKFILAQRDDSIRQRDLCRTIEELSAAGCSEVEKLRADTGFMLLLEEALTLLDENGSFFSEYEWNRMISGNVDARFRRYADQTYRRLLPGKRHRQTRSDIQPAPEPSADDLQYRDPHAREICKKMKKGNIAAPADDLSKEAKQWLSEKYPTNPYRREELLHMTYDGERMRSKLEVHTAELLKQLGIPYRYEPQMMIHGKTVYPDFVLMHPKTGKLIILEIFGLMSDEAYHANARKKIDLYLSAGYRINKTFLCYCEYDDEPLDFVKMKADLEYLFS